MRLRFAPWACEMVKPQWRGWRDHAMSSLSLIDSYYTEESKWYKKTLLICEELGNVFQLSLCVDGIAWAWDAWDVHVEHLYYFVGSPGLFPNDGLWSRTLFTPTSPSMFARCAHCAHNLFLIVLWGVLILEWMHDRFHGDTKLSTLYVELSPSHFLGCHGHRWCHDYSNHLKLTFISCSQSIQSIYVFHSQYNA